MSISHLPSANGEEMCVLSCDHLFKGEEDLICVFLMEGEGVVVGVGVGSIMGPEWLLYGM